MKSERLKKLELELHDLEEWLRLGLVPKKDMDKHKQEIQIIKKKINEEISRLHELKESGEVEEYTLPKRTPPGRQLYQEPHTIPGVESEGEAEMTDAGFDLETEVYETEATTISEEEGEGAEEETVTLIEEEEEDPFSDKSRWRRGILEDPESDVW